MAQAALMTLAKDKELTGRPRRVLDYLMAVLDFENFVQVSQADIAEELDLHRPDVSSAIKLLEQKEILIPGPKIGRSKCWRLNPNFGYKGNPNGKVKRHSQKGNLYLVGGSDYRDPNTPDMFTGRTDAE